MAAPMADAPPSNRLYAGNLSWRLSDATLLDAFAAMGATDAKIIMDRETGRSKGFGFVTFGDDDAARAAMDSMNGREVEGRAIRLAFASARPSGGPREGGDGAPREGGQFGGERRGFGAFGGGRRGGYEGGRGGGYGGGRGGYGGGRGGRDYEGGGRAGGYEGGGGYGGGYAQ